MNGLKLVRPWFKVEQALNGEAILMNIERYGRTCYKSEANITAQSAYQFVKNIIEKGHESVLEHEKITVRIVCDRGVSHEIVRHRMASYSQESTRYCNYAKNKFGNEVAFIIPSFFTEGSEPYQVWAEAMSKCEEAYFRLLSSGASPQEARTVLPNSLKTEIVMTMNLREWRLFFRLRASAQAHPQMVEIALPILEYFRARIPIIFDSL